MKALQFIFQYLKDWKNWLSHTIVGILILLFAFYFPIKPLFRVIILVVVITLNTLRMRKAKKRKISKKILILFICTFSLTLISNSVSSQQNNSFKEENVKVIGRGQVNWKNNSITISDCFITSKLNNPERFEMTLLVKGSGNEDQVQAWLGFGFQDRNNRYSLGLRGGNNNDLYLCKYQSNAKNKMLALESLEFQVVTDKWYKIKIVFWDGNIQVYLNDEINPRIITYDENFLNGGSTILGGGWLPTDFKNINIKELTEKEITQYKNNIFKYPPEISDQQKNKKREQQYLTYKPVLIETGTEPRTEISLNGDWLFMPDYQVKNDDKPYSNNLIDSNWHIMQVPSFWNPVRNWLHLQDSKFPHRGSGISDNYRENEESRCEGYTFDYKKTNSAWYRHKLEINESLEKKKVKLHFDAVSKTTDLYINGNFVGNHIGMFGDFEFDITKYLKKGTNILSVFVKARKEKKAANADENVTKAVSVDISNDMLNSLPHGMFNGDEGGIWQDVKLIITDPISIEDVFANTRLDGANFEITLNNDGYKKDTIGVKIEIVDNQSDKIIFRSPKNEQAIFDSKKTLKLSLKTGKIKPKLWTPEQPNMYTIVTEIYRKDNLIDRTSTNFGFRTFEAIGNKFYLNGIPYWLRGANHPPCGIAPNDSKLAHKFYKLMHDGNQMVTRSHACPFTSTWLDASDKQGVGVSYEGTWPWLLSLDIPSEELLEIWKNEMLSLVKKHRNHPSILMWTINNEMGFAPFYHNASPDERIKKWKIVSEVIKEIRKLSPNTAISADSGYSRVKEDYENNLEPNDIDDGDIDDRHVYFNWYNRDFHQIYEGEWAKRIYWSPGANPERPFFSQETSTGYTNNDDGHYNRKYLFNNYVPQAWVGDWAYEDKNPEITLKRHAFMTKELLEVIRRTSPETAGLLLFSNVCWFKDVYDFNKITPYPVYSAVKKAASPILISAELFGRNYYSGITIKPRICLVNNDIFGKNVPPSELEWAIEKDGKLLTSGSIDIDSVPHYDRLWIQPTIILPKKLPSLKSYCRLMLSVKSEGKYISSNDYDILIADKKWVTGQNIVVDKIINVFDLTEETFKILDFLNIKYNKLNDLTEIRTKNADLIIIANLDVADEIPYNWEDVKNVCASGTNVLLIHPGKHLQWLFYNKIESIYERKGRVVNMHIPEHEAFDEIDPMELAWWQQEGREKPRVCRRSFRLKSKNNIDALCTYLRPHTGLGNDREAYLKEMSGIPLLEIKNKKGRLIASEMEINNGDKDPIAAKLIVNIISDLLK